jgi:hypothetical protein
MNRNIAIGLIVLLVVAGLAFFVPTFLTQDTATMTVTFYDADDNVLYTATTKPTIIGWPGSFVTPDGSPIDHIDVTIEYTVTVSDSSLSWLHVISQLDVSTTITEYDRDHTPTVVPVNYISEPPQNFEVLTEEYTVTFTMVELIPVVTPSGKTNNWDILFKLDLTAEGETVDGTELSAEDHKELGFEIKWLDPTFSIVGSIT